MQVFAGLECRFQFGGDKVEALGDHRVEDGVGAADVVAAADCAKLELVAGEGEGAGAVAVAGFLGNAGQNIDAGTEEAALLAAFAVAGLDLGHDVLKLLAEEDAEDRRRCFVGSEAVIVGGRRDGHAQDVAIVINGTDDRDAEDEELSVVVGGFAGFEEVFAVGGLEGPVVVLAAAVDAGEGLFVEDGLHAVLERGAFERAHDEHLMIGGDVGRFVDGRKLVLAGGDFVVAGLDGDGELEHLRLGFDHEGQHAVGNRAEIVIILLVPLGRLGAEKGAVAVDQVRPGQEEAAIDEEIFLLRADGRKDPRRRFAEELENALGLLVDGGHRAEERGFLVERFTGVAEEGRRDDEGRAVGILHDKRGACRIPCGVAACFEGGADAAGRKAAGVGFALNEFLATEAGQCLAVGVGREKAVMLLSGQAGHGLKEVREVRGTFVDRPLLHGRRDGIAMFGQKRHAFVDGLAQRLEDRLGQAGALLIDVEDVDAEEVLDVNLFVIEPMKLAG